MANLFDICESRHGGNAQSRAAFRRVAPGLRRRQAEILEWIKSRGLEGATVKEVAARFGTTPNAVSGRLTELGPKGLRLIGDSNRRRDGCTVWVSVEVALGSASLTSGHQAEPAFKGRQGH